MNKSFSFEALNNIKECSFYLLTYLLNILLSGAVFLLIHFNLDLNSIFKSKGLVISSHDVHQIESVFGKSNIWYKYIADLINFWSEKIPHTYNFSIFIIVAFFQFQLTIFILKKIKFKANHALIYISNAAYSLSSGTVSICLFVSSILFLFTLGYFCLWLYIDDISILPVVEFFKFLCLYLIFSLFFIYNSNEEKAYKDNVHTSSLDHEPICYLVAIEIDPKSKIFIVNVPDLPDCFCEAYSFEDALRKTKQLIKNYLKPIYSKKKAIPLGSNIDSYINNKNYQGVIWATIEIDIHSLIKD